MLTQSGKYEEMLAQISEERRDQLSDFARDVAKIVKG
jgi:hypothetical protein